MTHLIKVKPGKGPAIEVFRVPGEKPTRFRYEPKPVHHKGKLIHERLGFKGNKVIEVAFVPLKHHNT